MRWALDMAGDGLPAEACDVLQDRERELRPRAGGDGDEHAEQRVDLLDDVRALFLL